MKELDNYVLVMPLIINFGLNLISAIHFAPKLELTARHVPNIEVLVNILFLVACTWILFYLENIMRTIFNLGLLFFYLTGMELYLFVISLELNE